MEDELELPAPRHEPSDISPRLIWIGAPALIAGVVSLALLVLWLFPGRTVDRTIHLPLPHYPAPELQVSPRDDWARFHAAQLKWLNSSGWVDQARGVTHLPIGEAMREVADEGLDGWPAPSPPRTTAPATSSPASGERP